MKIKIKEKKECKHKYVLAGVIKNYSYIDGSIRSETFIIFCEKCRDKKEL